MESQLLELQRASESMREEAQRTGDAEGQAVADSNAAALEWQRRCEREKLAAEVSKKTWVSQIQELSKVSVPRVCAAPRCPF